MLCFIKIYIFTIAYKVISTLISNVMLMWLNTAQRYFKNAYRAYKALFKLRKEVWRGTI